MDEITLALNKLNWRIEILQEIAANAYLTAFSLFEVLQSSPQSLSQPDLKILAAKILDNLSRDLEKKQKATYEKFFSDPSVPEEECALVAEEYAHVFEEMKSSLIPPWVAQPDNNLVSDDTSAKITKKKRSRR